MDRTYPPTALLVGGAILGVAATLTTQALFSPSASTSTTPTTTFPSPSPSPSTAQDELQEDIRDGLEGCIGNTPLIRLKSLSDATGCEILAKAEFLNPGGSVKDRVAAQLLRAAEGSGQLTPHSADKVYEGTVGSTGVSLAMLCRARGYSAHIVMPSDQSSEKASLLRKLGAEVTMVPPAAIVDQNQFVNRARALAREHSADPGKPGRGFFADQFENDQNWQAHYAGTAPEILRQCGPRGLDAFVAGAGTGGTISGCARFLKRRLSSRLRVVLADPPGSGLYNRVRYGVMFAPTEREAAHRRRHQVDSIVEGIGINRVTRNFEAGGMLIDDAVRVTDDEAMAMARFLVEKEGLFVGSSSAVNCVAAVRTALAMGPGHRVVTILCDSGARHLSKFWAQAGHVGGAWDMTLADVLHGGSGTVFGEPPKTDDGGGDETTLGESAAGETEAPVSTGLLEVGP